LIGKNPYDVSHKADRVPIILHSGYLLVNQGIVEQIDNLLYVWPQDIEKMPFRFEMGELPQLGKGAKIPKIVIQPDKK
jgi:hypothetical protein